MTQVSPDELLDLAEAMCRAPGPSLRGVWPRVAAFTTRLALETLLDTYWSARAPNVAECQAARPKMLCLPSYLGDDDVAHDAYEVWSAVSNACHRHAFELDPTLDELERWIARVRALHGVVRYRDPEADDSIE